MLQCIAIDLSFVLISKCLLLDSSGPFRVTAESNFPYFINSKCQFLTTKKPYSPVLLNPLPNVKFNTFEVKEFAEDNFEFDENGRKLSIRVENTEGKGEIARDEQFLLFPQ